VEEVNSNFISVFIDIRRNNMFANSKIMFCPENKPPLAGDNLYYFITHYGQFTNDPNYTKYKLDQVYAAREGREKDDTRIGCDVSQKTLWEMAQQTQFLLRARRIRFYDKCISGTNIPFNEIPYKPIEYSRLLMLQKILRVEMSAVRATKDTISKKDAGNNDGYIALAMGAYWPGIMIHNSKYSHFMEPTRDFYADNVVVDSKTGHAFGPMMEDPELQTSKRPRIENQTSMQF